MSQKRLLHEANEEEKQKSTCQTQRLGDSERKKEREGEGKRGQQDERRNERRVMSCKQKQTKTQTK